MGHHNGPDAEEVLVIKVTSRYDDPEDYDHSYMTYVDARGCVDGFVGGGSRWRPIAHGVRIIHSVEDDGTELGYWDFVDWQAYQANIRRLEEKGMFR